MQQTMCALLLSLQREQQPVPLAASLRAAAVVIERTPPALLGASAPELLMRLLCAAAGDDGAREHCCRLRPSPPQLTSAPITIAAQTTACALRRCSACSPHATQSALPRPSRASCWARTRRPPAYPRMRAPARCRRCCCDLRARSAANHKCHRCWRWRAALLAGFRMCSCACAPLHSRAPALTPPASCASARSAAFTPLQQLLLWCFRHPDEGVRVQGVRVAEEAARALAGGAQEHPPDSPRPPASPAAAAAQTAHQEAVRRPAHATHPAALQLVQLLSDHVTRALRDRSHSVRAAAITCFGALSEPQWLALAVRGRAREPVRAS